MLIQTWLVWARGLAYANTDELVGHGVIPGKGGEGECESAPEAGGAGSERAGVHVGRSWLSVGLKPTLSISKKHIVRAEHAQLPGKGACPPRGAGFALREGEGPWPQAQQAGRLGTGAQCSPATEASSRGQSSETGLSWSHHRCSPWSRGTRMKSQGEIKADTCWSPSDSIRSATLHGMSRIAHGARAPVMWT